MSVSVAMSMLHVEKSLAPLCTLHAQMNWSKASSATDLLQYMPRRLWSGCLLGSLAWLRGGQQDQRCLATSDSHTAWSATEHYRLSK